MSFPSLASWLDTMNSKGVGVRTRDELMPRKEDGTVLEM